MSGLHRESGEVPSAVDRHRLAEDRVQALQLLPGQDAESPVLLRGVTAGHGGESFPANKVSNWEETTAESLGPPRVNKRLALADGALSHALGDSNWKVNWSEVRET